MSSPAPRAVLPDHPRDGYASLRAEATRLAGAPGDIARRVMFHHNLYRDSAGNHVFPLIALHGALWAAGFFETTGRLGQALRTRYFYDARERAMRMGLLNGFASGFKSVNRSVFIDTWTNYFYTKQYGDHPDAGGVLHPELFRGLVAMHRVVRAGATLSAADKHQLFCNALRFEQEVTVAPGIQAEVARFDCPILRFLCLRPPVRFAYFPTGTFMFFKDFSNTEERVGKALRSYALAERAGWDRVEAAMQHYNVLPAAYLRDPAGYVAQLSSASIPS
ncbi:MAG: hypothetical protein ABL982_16690 [Vicinamibacterales bacterium]